MKLASKVFVSELFRSTLAQIPQQQLSVRRQRNSWAILLPSKAAPRAIQPLYNCQEHHRQCATWRGARVRSHYSVSQSDSNHTLKNWRLKHSTAAARIAAVAAATSRPELRFWLLATTINKLAACRARRRGHYRQAVWGAWQRVRYRLLRRGNDRGE